MRASTTLKIAGAALALLATAVTASLAQSLPNYGPNAPANGDSFGKPYSGTHPLPPGARAYGYSRHWHHRHWHRHRAGK